MRESAFTIAGTGLKAASSRLETTTFRLPGPPGVLAGVAGVGIALERETRPFAGAASKANSLSEYITPRVVKADGEPMPRLGSDGLPLTKGGAPVFERAYGKRLADNMAAQAYATGDTSLLKPGSNWEAHHIVPINTEGAGVAVRTLRSSGSTWTRGRPGSGRQLQGTEPGRGDASQRDLRPEVRALGLTSIRERALDGRRDQRALHYIRSVIESVREPWR